MNSSRESVETRGNVSSVKISDRSKEIILGSLLGDGCLTISKGYRNARFLFRHSIVQREYFLWKAKALLEMSAPKSIQIQKPDGWSTNKKLYYYSSVRTSLTELYHLTHHSGRLVMRKEWLRLLSPLSLLVWWLDDGSLVKNSRQGVFCTEGFTRPQIAALSRHLKSTWDIQTHIGRRGKYYQLRIYSTEELKKFFRLILPHFAVADMLPKVILGYQDVYLQQRWTSEISKLTGFSPSVIEKYLERKRQKWKKFRG